MPKKHKKVCKFSNYTEHLLLLASVVTGYVSIFAFASLFGILIGNVSSALGIKICATTAVIKKYKSIIKKKEKSMIK